MVKGGGMRGRGGVRGEGGRAWYEIRPVIARAVRILLECILVIFKVSFFHAMELSTVWMASCPKI